MSDSPEMFSKKLTYHFRLSSSSPGGAQNPGYELCSLPGHQVRSRLPAATDWPPPATTSSLYSITEQIHRLKRHLDFLEEWVLLTLAATHCVQCCQHVIAHFLCDSCVIVHKQPRKKQLKRLELPKKRLVLSSRETEGRPRVFTCCSSSDKKSSLSCCRASYSSAGVLMAGSPRVCNN